MKSHKVVKQLTLYTVLLIFSLISIYPIIWMVLGATKSTSDIFSVPPSFVPGKELFVNLSNLLNRTPIFHALGNSIFRLFVKWC